MKKLVPNELRHTIAEEILRENIISTAALRKDNWATRLTREGSRQAYKLMCRRHGIPYTGSKGVMMSRLTRHFMSRWTRHFQCSHCDDEEASPKACLKRSEKDVWPEPLLKRKKPKKGKD